MAGHNILEALSCEVCVQVGLVSILGEDVIGPIISNIWRRYWSNQGGLR